MAMTPIRLSAVAASVCCLATGAAAQTETVLHAFSALPRYGVAGPHDGGVPAAGLIVGDNGVLFGTTEQGGIHCGSNGPGCGSVFTVTPPQTGKTKYKTAIIARFNDTATGGYPMASVTPGPAGVYYGTSTNGGIGPSGSGYGVVFMIEPPVAGKTAWTRQELYRFAGAADGANPRGKLLLESDGSLIGTTQNGGAAGDGTVFQLVPPAAGKMKWTKHSLYSFSGSDGARPLAGLTALVGGVLVGTTSIGGSNNFGLVFGLTPPATAGGDWGESTLYEFPSYAVGVFPGAVDLIADGTGKLYGTTSQGGDAGLGTVFELVPPHHAAPDWTEIPLYSFVGGTDGATPMAGVTMDQAGALYGTTQAGGSASLGVAFKLSPPAKADKPWAESVLHEFVGGTDGSVPLAPLVLDTAGDVFGTTSTGGAACPQYTDNGCGTVFEIMP